MSDDLRALSDEELKWRDPATGKVHGTTTVYRNCTLGADGKQCDRCKEAKRRRNKLDQDKLRERDPDYFKKQTRRTTDRRRILRGEQPIWDANGELPFDRTAWLHRNLPPSVPLEEGFKELPPHIRHGTQHSYRYYKCHCSLCRAANAEKRNAAATKSRGHPLPGESKGWDGLPVEHLKDLPKGDPVKPLASRDSQYGTVRVEQPSKGRRE